jgi:RNA polymerase sigma-B factor
METVSMRNRFADRAGGGRPAPAGSTTRDLARLDDSELLHIVRSLPRASGRRTVACELLVIRHRNLVRSCVQRYRHSPEPAEDLMQVGYVGLLKAINNFDPAIGGSLAAYAQPCINGELKRHFRDRRWHAHVERPVQELVLAIREATGQLAQRLGHAPSETDLASYLGATTDELRAARRAEMALQPCSLDAVVADRPSPVTLADTLGQEDPGVEHALNMLAVATHWGELSRREQRVLLLRFYADLTQAEIGKRLGISQMQVSRLLAHALGFLRQRLLGVGETSTAPGRPMTADHLPAGAAR